MVRVRSMVLLSLNNLSHVRSLSSLNVVSMSHLLEHDHHELRSKLKDVMKDDLYRPRYNLTLSEERQLAYNRLYKIYQARLISVTDFHVTNTILDIHSWIHI